MRGVLRNVFALGRMFVFAVCFVDCGCGLKMDGGDSAAAVVLLSRCWQRCVDGIEIGYTTIELDCGGSCGGCESGAGRRRIGCRTPRSLGLCFVRRLHFVSVILVVKKCCLVLP